MPRALTLLPLLLLSQCLGRDAPGYATPIAPAEIAIAATPVSLFPGDPGRTRIGALRFLGGWALSADNAGFGGLSSLIIDRERFTALSDAGLLVRFRLGRFGHVSDASIAPLPRGCIVYRTKTDSDSESLAHDPVRGDWWVGFEDRNAICRINGDLSRASGLTAPSAMRNWPKTMGPETMLRRPDGRFLIIAEGAAEGGPTMPALLFDRDPANPAAHVMPMRYRPPAGFRAVDAATLPDGRILVLNRAFSPWRLFRAAITLLDPADLKAGAMLTGAEIARIESPAITDNYEGIAVTGDAARPIVWIISDDNYARWERTLLLKFALEIRPPSPSSRSRASGGAPSG